ncbi:hypothetical protein [Halapricum hydrolyticum]|uniref:DUF8152 domain-containing protein n=1 Tax=Halapricum hydrolyticum TaxID=2979991 RepID=A0AAE3LIV4_9EURY|nr:hypothetical protein [Halapricum hydrolyticum]MCU4719228.1 hypothetical protein [Halapricum hydrolyticum]MCU4728339.1 hypothetical protein [Halapricum hydrolyticum]
MTEPIADADERRTAVVELHDHLAATAELPIERTANRWIGEAQAVAADLVDAPNDPELIRERTTHIAALLDEVEDTDDPTANEHVATAAQLADRLRRE